jgi:hypothetical protein
MLKLQQMIEKNMGPFYLSAFEIAQSQLQEKLSIYQPKSKLNS